MASSHLLLTGVLLTLGTGCKSDLGAAGTGDTDGTGTDASSGTTATSGPTTTSDPSGTSAGGSGSSTTTASTATDSASGSTGPVTTGSGSTTGGATGSGSAGSTSSTSGSTSSTTGSTSSGTTGSTTGAGSTGGPCGCDVIVGPADILDCSPGLLDSVDHNSGDGYGVAGDDLRVGSCSPTACTSAGKTATGVDLEFEVNLPANTPLTGGSLKITGFPNSGGADSTVEVFDYETNTKHGECVLTAGDWTSCTVLLDHTLLEPTTTRLYTNQSDPPCYVVFDHVELTVEY